MHNGEGGGRANPQRPRSDWGLLVDRVVELSMAVQELGFEDADALLKAGGGRARGRVLGVDSGGIWFEFMEHTEAAQTGKLALDEVPHFYVTYSSLRSARATTMSAKRSNGRAKAAAAF